MNMPYMPAPTPPKMISPSKILSMATPPANGDRLLCILFTEPLDAAIVVTAHTDAVGHAKTGFFALHDATCPINGIGAIFADEHD